MDKFKFERPKQKVRCTGCNGTGRQMEMGEEICHNCAGTGRDVHSDLWAEPCRSCNGRGKKPYCGPSPRGRPCMHCGGKGLIEI